MVHASRSNFTSTMADESKGCAFALAYFSVHFLVWTLFSLCATAQTKGFVFSIPNLEIQQLPDLLNQHGSFNWHKLDHSLQFDKTLLQGLPYDNNCAFRSFVAESARSPWPKQSRTLSLFLRMDEIRGKTSPIFAGTHLQDHLGGPQITLHKDFSHCCCKFFIARFVWELIVSQEFHVLFEMCFKNHRNVKLPVISQHAINVAAMRETLRAQDTQIWNHKCIIAWCKPQARTKTRARILHMHARIWTLSAACLGLNRHYTHKNRRIYVKFQLHVIESA